ncbi:MAG: CsbD family protein [Terracidiphilus sp.]
MNKDTVKGTVDDAAGRVKRQVGEWTGDTNAQVEGAGQQIKGKVEKAWGNVKDAAHDASKSASKNATTDTERDNEARERQRHEEERKHHEVIGS